MNYLLKYRAQFIRPLLKSMLFITVTCLFTGPTLAAEKYAIFTLDSDFEALSVHKARKLYRGKTKRLQGKRIELSDWPADSSERSEFYRYLLNKNLAQMNAHWASLSFSGKARPPMVIKTANIQALLAWMGEKPNRIGYAPLSVLPANAQLLYVVSSEN